MVITDLDGTLLNTRQQVSLTDYETLLWLGKQGHTRVIATGRSPYSFSRVIRDDFPIDYLVFSSGSGILNWKTREVIESYVIGRDKVRELVQLFLREQVSFKVLEPAPNNHQYVYYNQGDNHPDFEKRMEFYRGFEQEICFDPPNFDAASQFLIILKANVDEFERLSKLCMGVKVIRATSPLDHQSIWMEVFHPEVSKGNACASLCKQLGISASNTVAVGNDYNDIDLLRFAAKSFAVRNAPPEIQNMCTVVASNDDSGFSEAVRMSRLL